MGDRWSTGYDRGHYLRQAIEERRLTLGPGPGKVSTAAPPETFIGWDAAIPGEGKLSTFHVSSLAPDESWLRTVIREEIEAAETRRRLEARPGELEALTARWRYAAGRR